jgi:hypothetical protein
MTEEQRIIESALKIYGASIQKIIVIEELSELTKAICKDIRGADNIDDIIDELVDVDLMMKQAKLIYMSTPELRQRFMVRHEYKLNRLKERIDNRVLGLLWSRI